MIVRTTGSLLALLFALSSASAALGEATPLPGIAAAGKQPYLAVIVWHDVVRDGKEVWFDTTLADFKTQLEGIKRGNFHVVSLDTLRAHLERGAAVPSRPLVLTFDDNGRGIYENAFPLLRRYRFPATLFVHTNYVGKTTSKRHNSWDDLRDMQRSGLITVQSLTANHPEDLRALSDHDVVHELQLSKFSLEHRLGHPVYALAYPYDNYDDRVARLASQNGYVLGFTEDWGNAGTSSSLLVLHRYSALTRFDQALGDVRRQSPVSCRCKWQPSSASSRTSRASASTAADTSPGRSTDPSSAKNSLSLQSSQVSSGSPSTSAGKRTQKP
jgi:peptidoglycan/xylan/chitin deacetylase (PgdA/CDA1 family)